MNRTFQFFSTPTWYCSCCCHIPLEKPKIIQSQSYLFSFLSKTEPYQLKLSCLEQYLQPWQVRGEAGLSGNSRKMSLWSYCSWLENNKCFHEYLPSHTFCHTVWNQQTWSSLSLTQKSWIRDPEPFCQELSIVGALPPCSERPCFSLTQEIEKERHSLEAKLCPLSLIHSYSKSKTKQSIACLFMGSFLK